MSTIGGANIVREGLVLYLDAANQKSYLSGSTVWRDLSLNNNSGSLVNGPTFDSANMGSIVFDGVNDYYSSSFFTVQSNHTIISWVNITSLNKNWIPIIEFKSGSTYRAHYYVQGDLNPFTNQIRGFGANWSTNGTDDNSSWTSENIATVEANKWTMFTGRVDGIYGDTYIDTQKSKPTKTLISYTNIGIQGFMNARPGDTLYNPGKFATLLIYNIALTDTQILQNYEALKSRYI
jgi:hypothetical protein